LTTITKIFVFSSNVNHILLTLFELGQKSCYCLVVVVAVVVVVAAAVVAVVVVAVVAVVAHTLRPSLNPLCVSITQNYAYLTLNSN